MACKYTLNNKLLILFNLIGLSCLSGCGALYGTLIDPFVPARTIPAELNLENQTVLIWVDNVASQATPHLRRELTEQLRQQLLAQKAVGSVIEYPLLARFRHRHPDANSMTIQQLGRKFFADRVLYILINQFHLRHEAGEGYYRTSITGYAKVIDVSDGQLLWPADMIHRPFNYSGILATGSGENFEIKQIRELCRQTSSKIAPCFYDHKEKK